MRRLVTLLVAILVLGLDLTAVAGPLWGHPNLRAAMNSLNDALGAISAAQSANEYDMAGHAARAKDLIHQAKGELEAAGMAANANGAR